MYFLLWIVCIYSDNYVFKWKRCYCLKLLSRGTRFEEHCLYGIYYLTGHDHFIHHRTQQIPRQIRLSTLLNRYWCSWRVAKCFFCGNVPRTTDDVRRISFSQLRNYSWVFIEITLPSRLVCPQGEFPLSPGSVLDPFASCCYVRTWQAKIAVSVSQSLKG